MSYFNKKTFVWVIILLVIINIFSISALFVQHSRIESFFPKDRLHTPRPPECTKIEHLMKHEIGFSDTQIESFNKLRDEHAIEMKLLNIQHYKLKQKLIDGAFTDIFTSEDADSLLQEISDIQIEIEKNNHYHLVKMKMICEPGQKEKLKELLKEAMKRHNPKFHDRNCNRPPERNHNKSRKEIRKHKRVED